MPATVFKLFHKHIRAENAESIFKFLKLKSQEVQLPLHCKEGVRKTAQPWRLLF